MRSYQEGFSHGVGDNLQLEIWDLRPPGGGPPVRQKNFSVDAQQMVKNFPTRYQYAEDGDPVPKRSPMTAAEREAETVQGEIEKLKREQAEAEKRLAVIRDAVERQVYLLRNP
jgi:hypothetical protein